MVAPLLDVRGLEISYTTPPTTIVAVRDIFFQVDAGETLALVGETGCGKSSIALALMGLLDNPDECVTGEVLLEGRNLLSLNADGWRRFRGKSIALVFQNARASLNPVLTIGNHFHESLSAHGRASRQTLKSRALEILGEVGIPAPDAFLKRYPSELSGGMCQRVAIGLGICNLPQLLIADEPTSALDPSLQMQILALLQEMKRRHRLSLLLITHDLAVVSSVADRIAVMYHGRIVETGAAREVLTHPKHPYTQGLVASLPGFDHHKDGARLSAISGSPPKSGEDLPGCAFAPRCPNAIPRCKESVPPLLPYTEGHGVACPLAS